MKQLILGGARSGKSSLGERLAAGYGDDVGYIATADSRFNDESMAARIARHQQQRPGHWKSYESPVDLPETLTELDTRHCVLLVDCLTLWVSNCLLDETLDWESRKQQLLNTVDGLTTPLIMISNEVGMGVVPMGEISRRFVDESGFLHQTLAQRCDRVVLMAAGLPLVMKGEPLNGERVND